jgi:hypothetical protein
LSIVTLPFDQWSHVAVTFRRIGPTIPSPIEVLLYIDGQQQGVQSGGSIGGITNLENLLIGGTRLPIFAPDAGISLDELEIFNSALSQPDIAAIYAAGNAGKCKCVPTPDRLGCTDFCPNSNDICKPTERVFDGVSGWIVTKCDCIGEEECYIELSTTDPPGPFCTGGTCPGGQPCQLTQTPIANGTLYECCANPVPTVSEWGLVVMTLIGLTAGTVLHRRTNLL